MHLTLTANGVDSGVELWTVSVGDDGHWTYQSRAVEFLEGDLSPADRAQLKHFYDEIDWDIEVLNNPVSADDRLLFKLEVTHEGSGDRRLYQFSEAMNHLQYQFKDLVHFLRKNVAKNADVSQQPPFEPQDRPQPTV